MSAPSGKSDFFEIKDQAMISKILDIAQRHRIPITLWLKSQTIKFETTTAHYMVNMKKWAVHFPPEVAENDFQVAIATQKSSDILGSFQIDTVNFFFKTQCLPKDKTWLPLEIPSVIFKLQRRANLRIPFGRTTAPALTCFDPSKDLDPAQTIKSSDILAFRVIDVSAGGVGIAVPVEMKAKFPSKATIHDIHFKLKNGEIITNGTVKHVIESVNDQNKPFLKVGIQFAKLKPQAEQLIVQFVLEESRKLFSLLH